MPGNTIGYACPYREVIVSMDKNEPNREGYDSFSFDRTGKIIEGARLWLANPKRVIAVHREYYRPISDATERLKQEIGPTLFRTREEVRFKLDMRIATSRDRTRRIAECHFDDEKGPEQLFYSYFGDRLRRLLEVSAKSDSDDIDTRIARNKKEWETALAAELSARFAIRVELDFDVDTVIPKDTAVASDPAAPLLLVLRDRIDRTVPASFELRIARDPALPAKSALPGDRNRLRDAVADVIRQAASEEIRLFDYWYDQKRMNEVLKPRIAAYLNDFGFCVANLLVKNVDSAKPPAHAVKLDTRVPWEDSYGHPLEFRAEAIAEIHPDGAGRYDRAGRPDRAAWFERTMAACLRRVLAGTAINDFSDAAISRKNDEIKACISAEAEVIGLELTVFVGTPFLPLQRWLTVNRVRVPETTYPTAHPTIHGHFSMDMEVMFESRKAIDGFVADHARTGRGTNARLPDDQFVEDCLIAAAKEAAQLVMQTTAAETYFSTYIGAGEWDNPTGEQGLPGQEREKDANRIQAKLSEILERRYPGVGLQSLSFHRRDQHLEALRSKVAALKTIDFTCELVDRDNAGLDRTLDVYLTIAGGHATQVVMMLSKRLQDEETEALRRLIANHLRKVVSNRLSHINNDEIESLAASLTLAARDYTSQARNEIVNVVRHELQSEFGLQAGTIELTAGRSGEVNEVRLMNQTTRQGKLKRIRQKLTILQDSLENLLIERLKITDTTPEARERRRELGLRIEETEREIEAQQNEMRGDGLLPHPEAPASRIANGAGEASPPQPDSSNRPQNAQGTADPQARRSSETNWDGSL
ncbi:hypothetical protein [Fulvimarina sp. MAC3]|uniref:hypothetical protein n=1 Tax=Fulvimarina sp. MAC3 TaxID=3148887 RepID=UPI0031FBDDA5